MSEGFGGGGGEPDGLRGSLERSFEPEGEAVTSAGGEDVELDGDVEHVQVGLGRRQKVYRKFMRLCHANANVEGVLGERVGVLMNSAFYPIH